MLIILTAAALTLTFIMFLSKNMMLGFPSGIFWALLGGYSYTLSTTTWDMYYFLFFASMGMTIFAIYAAFGLREKKDAIADKEMDEDSKEPEPTYIDEKKAPTKLAAQFENRRQRRRDRYVDNQITKDFG